MNLGLESLGVVNQDPPRVDHMRDMSGCNVDIQKCVMQLIQQGTRAGGGSWVYSVKSQPQDASAASGHASRPASANVFGVLKLTTHTKEVRHGLITQCALTHGACWHEASLARQSSGMTSCASNAYARNLHQSTCFGA